MKTRYRPCVITLMTFLLVQAPAAGATMMGWYMPVNLGASWSYQNEDPPHDIVVDTVFELIEYEGHPAYRFGTDLNDHNIVWSEAGMISIFATVENGVLIDLADDVTLGKVVDGDYFIHCFATPCDTSLIRVWEELDPSLRSIYGVDPAFTDMIMFASYDPDFPPNLQNVVVESNLPEGVTLPTGAVTGIDLYLRGVGLLESWDVEAATGGLQDHYVLQSVSATGDGPLPAGIVVERVAPNPFNPRTTISYRLGTAATVTLGIYDSAGRLVRSLVRGVPKGVGTHQEVWDGTDAGGRAVATGVYLCRIATGQGAVQAKLCLVR